MNCALCPRCTLVRPACLVLLAAITFLASRPGSPPSPLRAAT